MSESEEYDFEYSEEEEELDDNEVMLENLYYDSKSILDEEKDKAINGFRKIVEMEEEPGNWSFKALKKLCKIYCLSFENDKLISTYEELLQLIKKDVVTRAVSEKGINSILNKLQNKTDLIKKSNHVHDIKNLLQQQQEENATKKANGNSTANGNTKTTTTSSAGQTFEKIYELTLQTAREIRNDRLWLKTYLTLGNLYAEIREFDKLIIVLRNLHNAHEDAKEKNKKKNADGIIINSSTTNNNNNNNKNSTNNNDNSNNINTNNSKQLNEKNILSLEVFTGTNVLEIHALQILLYTAQKDNIKLKSLYEKALQIRGTVPHPRILGVIRECGGKMHMREKLWDSARRDFFEAFKSYDEAGDPSRIRCLKYLVLANMLMGSKINPFTSQEAKPYEFHPEVKAMTKLVKAYDSNEIQKFESILKKNRKSILEDDLIKLYVEELLQTVRIKVIKKTIKPYNSIRVSYLSSILSIEENSLYELLLTSIMDGVIKCKIDQVNGILIFNDRHDVKTQPNARDEALIAWTKALKKHSKLLSNRSDNLVMTKY